MCRLQETLLKLTQKNLKKWLSRSIENAGRETDTIFSIQ